MRSSLASLSVLVATTLLFSVVSTSLGQSSADQLAQATPADPAQTSPPATNRQVPAKGDPFSPRFRLRGFYGYQLDTNLDDGSFDINRALVGFTWGKRLSPDVDLSLGFDYAMDFYNFKEATGFGGDPWDNVQTISMSARFTYAVNDQWSLFAGPLFEFTRETGADWGDSLVGGGFAGAAVKISDDLLLGLGVGAMDQIQDSVYWFPQIIIDWKLAADWRISSRVRRGGYRTGVELIWDLQRDWEAAIGGTYDKDRFRLSDDNEIAPDGAGDNRGIPLWARLSCETNDLTISLWGAVVVDGRLEVEDADGNRVGKEDYQTALVVGISARFDF